MTPKHRRLAHDRALAQGMMAYVRWRYQVPAKRGGRVRYQGKLGTIRSANSWGHLCIRLDGERVTLPYHPHEGQLAYL